MVLGFGCCTVTFSGGLEFFWFKVFRALVFMDCEVWVFYGSGFLGFGLCGFYGLGFLVFRLFRVLKVFWVGF